MSYEKSNVMKNMRQDTVFSLNIMGKAIELVNQQPSLGISEGKRVQAPNTLLPASIQTPTGITKTMKVKSPVCFVRIEHHFTGLCMNVEASKVCTCHIDWNKNMLIELPNLRRQAIAFLTEWSGIFRLIVRSTETCKLPETQMS